MVRARTHLVATIMLRVALDKHKIWLPLSAAGACNIVAERRRDATLPLRVSLDRLLVGPLFPTAGAHIPRARVDFVAALLRARSLDGCVVWLRP